MKISLTSPSIVPVFVMAFVPMTRILASSIASKSQASSSVKMLSLLVTVMASLPMAMIEE